MSKYRVTVLLAALATLIIIASAPSTVLAAASKSPPKPKITMEEARATALARVPGGKVRSAELEHEHGRLVYSFDISVPGHAGIEEVQVDANRGTIVSHVHETPSMERKEAQQEKAKAKK